MKLQGRGGAPIPPQGWMEVGNLHSMARANLNKSVWLVTNTITASKYIPKRTRIVRIVKQGLLHKKTVFENFKK